jgi:hypothetical protein
MRVHSGPGYDAGSRRFTTDGSTVEAMLAANRAKRLFATAPTRAAPARGVSGID